MTTLVELCFTTQPSCASYADCKSSKLLRNSRFPYHFLEADPIVLPVPRLRVPVKKQYALLRSFSFVDISIHPAHSQFSIRRTLLRHLLPTSLSIPSLRSLTFINLLPMASGPTASPLSPSRFRCSLPISPMTPTPTRRLTSPLLLKSTW